MGAGPGGLPSRAAEPLCQSTSEHPWAPGGQLVWPVAPGISPHSLVGQAAWEVLGLSRSLGKGQPAGTIWGHRSGRGGYMGWQDVSGSVSPQERKLLLPEGRLLGPGGSPGVGTAAGNRLPAGLTLGGLSSCPLEPLCEPLPQGAGSLGRGVGTLSSPSSGRLRCEELMGSMAGTGSSTDTSCPHGPFPKETVTPTACQSRGGHSSVRWPRDK